MIQMTFKYAVLLSRGGLDRFKAGLAAEIQKEKGKRKIHKPQPGLGGSSGQWLCGGFQPCDVVSDLVLPRL